MVTTQQTNLKGQPCNFAALLGAVFGKNPDDVVRSWGLTPIGNMCLNCGKRIPRDNRKFCSMACFKVFAKVPLVCPVCLKTFYRSAKEIVWKLNHNQSTNGKPIQQFFCSRQCMGSDNGVRYGFKSHPENAFGKRSRKWDWDLIYKTHLNTGYGATKLSRLLGIPEGTVSTVLNKTRAAMLSKE